MNAIYFDMDGTIADLYHQPNWLKRLREFDPKPYKNAEPMVDVRKLKNLLEAHKARGVKVGVISWLSKGSTPAYDKAVRVAKVDWLEEHFGLGFFDAIHVVPYGTPKHEVAKEQNAILFDDNSSVRKTWNLGAAYTENDIFKVLEG